MLVPLNDLQGELQGMAGRNFLKQQLQPPKIDMPSISNSAKDGGILDFGLQESNEEEANKKEATAHPKKKLSAPKREQSTCTRHLVRASIEIHRQLPKTEDTRL